MAGVFLQWSHESSLPVSRTMVTCCGGEPTDNRTVRDTLCWKESLFGGRGIEPGGICWALRGKITVLGMELRVRFTNWESIVRVRRTRLTEAIGREMAEKEI